MADIISIYADAAKAIARAAGTRPVIVHVEPDWFQYAGPGQTEPLSWAEARTGMASILKAVSTGCPSCKIAIDVSTWCTDLTTYFSGWDLSHVSYAAVVGKAFAPTTAPIDATTFAPIHAITGKPVIIGNSYGPDGKALAYWRDWDNRAALTQLADAGVAMVMQPNTERAHYADVIAGFAKKPVPIPTRAGFGFTLSPNVNVFWAEVLVAAPKGSRVTKVEAIVEGETWHELTLQSWGNWAANFFVAWGTHVVFRAWDATGAPHDSDAYVWP